MNEPEFEAKVIRVLDGDTVDVIFSFPFGISVTKRIRMYGINAPETRTRNREEKLRGKASKKRLVELLGKERVCIIKYYGDGKFGRPLGELFVNGVNLNQVLVKEGHAVSYFGGKR